MENLLIQISLLIGLLPLAGSLIAGLLGKRLGTTLTHRIAISFVGIAFFLSCYMFWKIVIHAQPAIDHVFYTWASAGVMNFDVGFLIDRLSATMTLVVLFVSLMVHIYTIGYMEDDPGYTRFFSYVSLFTFSMLMLVLSNNLLLLFFGWEGVGVVSYLLIGFWFKREAANFGSLKAFLVNRLGDIGFILGIAVVLWLFGTLNYHEVFRQVPSALDKVISVTPDYSVNAITFVSLLLFIGAMAKSAQVPMHVWLPESMEGPTPISALIHAATMVTAGIYMVSRMSPIFEYSPQILSFILIIGGTTAFFTGLLAVVQNDIKRVIAYSTLSQLGYMAVALGASAYDAAIFHLVTHAFFKALLFLAAGSVIIAMHHEQDMRKMGGLARYLPITYITFVIGSLALCAIPPFSGFYSKDTIIEAVKLSEMPGAGYAYWCVLLGAFVTPLYSFRALFMTFHTKPRMDEETRSHLHEPSWVVWVPLVLLSIPSVVSGQMLIYRMLYAHPSLLGDSIFILPEHDVIAKLGEEFPGSVMMALDAGLTPTFWLTIAGIATAWLFTAYRPSLSTWFTHRFSMLYKILLRKYGFDDFNQIVLVRGTQETGTLFYDVSDVKLIDGSVNGSGAMVRWVAKVVRNVQTGYLYHYALAMVLGITVFLIYFMWG
ncbi:MAG TPA: NADH-quinone oxidoreductase subunit L [Gammaproteobacteria bacterium]|nr:NADH-quinone oxidoreductase subunit L [Gammaproteobacteria bacterium]